jgi:large subunit ribosomal protein L16
MLQPKRVKYRRPHSLKWEGLSKAGNTVAFGDYGLQATEGEYVSDRQIEAARVVLNNFTKRSGKVWIRIFPHMAKTKKPAEVRMGSGKGNPEFWVAVVKINRVMFEIGGVPAKDAIEALRLASFKLPVKTKIIKREVKDVSVVKAAKPVKETKAAQEGGK